jgi:hypothetical protein
LEVQEDNLRIVGRESQGQRYDLSQKIMGCLWVEEEWWDHLRIWGLRMGEVSWSLTARTCSSTATSRGIVLCVGGRTRKTKSFVPRLEPIFLSLAQFLRQEFPEASPTSLPFVPPCVLSATRVPLTTVAGVWASTKRKHRVAMDTETRNLRPWSAGGFQAPQGTRGSQSASQA